MKTNTTRSYKDLVVWQKGIAVAKLVYALTRTFPSEEKFGIVAQMRRAAEPAFMLIAELRRMLNALRRKLAVRQ